MIASQSPGSQWSSRARRPGQLPAGRHGISRHDVAASQRERILRALGDSVAAHGYRGLRVGDVIARAGVSRKTFYELFPGKEECFIELYERAMDSLLATALAAYDAQTAWGDRLRAALGALLGALALQPRLARVCFVEAAVAGGEVVARRDSAIARFSALFDAEEVSSRPLSQTLVNGRVSELHDALRRAIAAGGTSVELPRLLPELMYALVLPFLGPEAAQRELERGRAAA